LSPCHLASIPLLVGYINIGESVSTPRAFFTSILFAAGILISIALIGFITAFTGRLIGDIGRTSDYLIIIIFILFGLYLMDILKLGGISIQPHIKTKKWYMIAFLFGIITGISLGPCTFAFLAPILSIVFDVSNQNMSKGIYLLSAFAAGHCLLIAAIGTMAAKMQTYLNWTQNSKAVTYVRRICGAIMVLFAVYYSLNLF
jgi:cytochrome c-type biogenesis protein